MIFSEIMKKCFNLSIICHYLLFTIVFNINLNYIKYLKNNNASKNGSVHLKKAYRSKTLHFHWDY